jgi:DNA-binding XRE family transcriptional regulator
METMSERLKGRRRALAISQEGLAATSQVALRTVQRIEVGCGYDPKMGTVTRIASALQVEPAWLMYGEGEGPVNPTAQGSAKNSNAGERDSRGEARALTGINR